MIRLSQSFMKHTEANTNIFCYAKNQDYYKMTSKYIGPAILEHSGVQTHAQRGSERHQWAEKYNNQLKQTIMQQVLFLYLLCEIMDNTVGNVNAQVISAISGCQALMDHTMAILNNVMWLVSNAVQG